MSEKRFERLEFDDGAVGIHDNNTQDQYYYAIDCLDLLNSQDRKINVLKNHCSVMNQRLSEKSKCEYKKAIIEFCKFMGIDTPLLGVMVDEFLQEVMSDE